MTLREEHVFKASEALIILYNVFRKKKSYMIQFIFAIVLQLFRIILKHEEAITRESLRMTLIASRAL